MNDYKWHYSVTRWRKYKIIVKADDLLPPLFLTVQEHPSGYATGYAMFSRETFKNGSEWPIETMSFYERSNRLLEQRALQWIERELGTVKSAKLLEEESSFEDLVDPDYDSSLSEYSNHSRSFILEKYNNDQ